jgi:hypothetical protein
MDAPTQARSSDAQQMSAPQTKGEESWIPFHAVRCWQ